MTDATNLLLLVVDVSPRAWATPRVVGSATVLDECLASVGALVTAYRLMDPRNDLVVLAAGRAGSSPHVCGDGAGTGAEVVVEQLRALALSEDGGPEVGLSGALAAALCCANKALQSGRSVRPRVLVLQASEDVGAEYVPLMNTFFSALRKSVPVDACVLTRSESTFLQQGCDLTGGMYARPHNLATLTQHLLSLFAVDAETRRCLHTPAVARVDHRVLCFCHRRPIAVGRVCSVCLATYCSPRPTCTMCGAKFSTALPVPKKRKKKKKKKKKKEITAEEPDKKKQKADS